MNPLSQLLVPYESEELHGHEFFVRYLPEAEQTELAQIFDDLPDPDDDDHVTRGHQAKFMARLCVVKSVRLSKETAENVKPELTEEQANILLLRMARMEQCGAFTGTKLAELAMDACGFGVKAAEREEEAGEPEDGEMDSDEKKEAEDPLASGGSSGRSSTT